MARSVGILGGSFNPVHIGHLRLAVEAAERLGFERMDFVPSARPPHKASRELLDFDLRVRLLEAGLASLADLPAPFRVNTAEGQRQGPSYTWDTLGEYRRQEPEAELYFLLGAKDLPALPGWRRGLALPDLAHFVVAGGDEQDADDLAAFACKTWPGLAPEAPCPGAARTWRFPSGKRLIVLSIPRLDISASLARALWRSGKSLSCLVPAAVEKALLERRASVEAAWGARGDERSGSEG